MAESSAYVGKTNRRRRFSDRRAPAGAYSAPNQSLARMVILAALLLMTIYSGFASYKLVNQPPPGTLAQEALHHRT